MTLAALVALVLTGLLGAGLLRRSESRRVPRGRELVAGTLEPVAPWGALALVGLVATAAALSWAAAPPTPWLRSAVAIAAVAAAALGGGPVVTAVLAAADPTRAVAALGGDLTARGAATRPTGELRPGELRSGGLRSGELRSGEVRPGEGRAGMAGIANPDVLRGGSWIGVLERLALAATLLAGWPEGLPVVLAIKGLGRFQALKETPAAERFIIGTLTSVLWAAACAGVAVLAR